jgi:hypothetical protein
MLLYGTNLKLLNTQGKSYDIVENIMRTHAGLLQKLGLRLLLVFCMVGGVSSCATTKGMGGKGSGGGGSMGSGSPGFRLFGGDLSLNPGELIGGVIVLLVILAAILIIRRLTSGKK